jgi:hypothetical protein
VMSLSSCSDGSHVEGAQFLPLRGSNNLASIAFGPSSTPIFHDRFSLRKDAPDRFFR